MEIRVAARRALALELTAATIVAVVAEEEAVDLVAPVPMEAAAAHARKEIDAADQAVAPNAEEIAFATAIVSRHPGRNHRPSSTA